MDIAVLALDLEATLVDNALSAEPRTGLAAFLAYCHSQFERVALFTTVEETDAREVVDELVRTGHWPNELAARLEYIDWGGEHKDLRFIPDVTPAEVVLIDDDAGWVCRDQIEQWIQVTAWDGVPDCELQRVQEQLTVMLRDR